MGESRTTASDADSAQVLEKVQKLIGVKGYDTALQLLRVLWLAEPENKEATSLMSKVMQGKGKAELAANLAELAAGSGPMYENVQHVFEAGFRLIDEREPQLAIMLLSRCVDKLPNQPLVAYELGFALMAVREYKEAITYLERSLKLENNFDTQLNLSVCHLLTGNLQAANQAADALASLANDEEEKREANLRKQAVQRLTIIGNKKNLTARDWLYVMYGTLILSEPMITSEQSEDLKAQAAVQSQMIGVRLGDKLININATQKPSLVNHDLALDTAGKSGMNSPDYKQVAWTLLVLSKILRELGMEFDVVEFYSPLSRPLSEALAHILGLPVQGYGGPARTDRALLLLAWAPNIIGPHKSFQTMTSKRTIFAYGLPSREGLPLTPEIVGELCSNCLMPWADTSDEPAERRRGDRLDLPDELQAKATDRILEAVAELESQPEIIQAVEELLTYYRPKRELLLMGNASKFLERPEYTAEIPS